MVQMFGYTGLAFQVWIQGCSISKIMVIFLINYIHQDIQHVQKLIHCMFSWWISNTCCEVKVLS